MTPASRAIAGTGVLALAIGLSPQVGRAHDPDFVLGGVGTAVVDGVLSPGEWDRAGTRTFDVALPPNDGGGTTPVTLLIMNDATNLYVAFRVSRPVFGGGTNVSIHFDADHDRDREPGDDGFGMAVGEFSPPTLVDVFHDGLNDLRDDEFGGTNDGTTAATTDGTFTYVEMSHPLDNTDDAHDFSLGAGDFVGFGGFVHLFSLDALCNEGGPPCSALTSFAGGFQDPVGDLLILSSAPGSCHHDAAEARRRFVDACVAAGASPGSCNRTGTEIMLALVASCSP